MPVWYNIAFDFKVKPSTCIFFLNLGVALHSAFFVYMLRLMVSFNSWLWAVFLKGVVDFDPALLLSLTVTRDGTHTALSPCGTVSSLDGPTVPSLSPSPRGPGGARGTVLQPQG